jgi:hypothetical protein
MGSEEFKKEDEEFKVPKHPRWRSVQAYHAREESLPKVAKILTNDPMDKALI